MTAPLATCPRCSAPLIATFAFAKYEFYCLDCGNHLGFFGPRAAEPTPELDARYEGYLAEWQEHAGSRLLVVGARHRGCAECEGGQYHLDHATDAEREADRAARAWLAERRTRAAA